MAQILRVVSETSKIEKLFIPAELATFPGSLFHKHPNVVTIEGGSIAGVLEKAVEAYVAKLIEAGIYGTWTVYQIDTQSPAPTPDTPDTSYEGYEQITLWSRTATATAPATATSYHHYPH